MDLESSSKIIISVGDFNGRVGKWGNEGFEGVNRRMVLGKEMQKK